MNEVKSATVPFIAPGGAILATLTFNVLRQAEKATPSILELSEQEAELAGEAKVQLREGERYEYRVQPRTQPTSDFRIRIGFGLSKRWPSLEGQRGDAGILETRTRCGSLVIELVDGSDPEALVPLGVAMVEVRSIKLDYRSDYRTMLVGLSERIAGLVVDARSSSKQRFGPTLERSISAGQLQIQVELLREKILDRAFEEALQRILNFPHERLAESARQMPSGANQRWDVGALRQLVAGAEAELPTDHPLKVRFGVQSVARVVSINCRRATVDTPENRFIKYALIEYRAFLSHAAAVFDSTKGWDAPAATARGLGARIDSWLARGFFTDIGELALIPISSPVLQRKAGYREIFSSWIQFHAACELSWIGGESVFQAGQRDVATLYEYWLFFELLDWFSTVCCSGERPELSELVEGLDGERPNLRLRQRIQLGPFVGKYSGEGRELNATFSYNRVFRVSHARELSGSWTRRLHPDYTLSFWPVGMSAMQAEANELLAHIHFDAKYRVENLDTLFGAFDSEDVDDEVDGNYKRQDLLKMHAYRDAIKRSHGAYVLYPGRGVGAEKMHGFHEILPGLGAFSVVPNPSGSPLGFKALSSFLADVLTHLSNRTTSLERWTYHTAESYRLKEQAVTYGGISLSELDDSSLSGRPPPPSEHHVLLAWYNSFEQLRWTLSRRMVVIRLGDRPGTWKIPPELASTRHVLLRTHGLKVENGLLKLEKPGYQVYTAADLLRLGYPGSAGGEIYAVFSIEPDPVFEGQQWDGGRIWRLIQSVMPEGRPSHARRSPDPTILSLRQLLQTLS